MDPFEGKEVDAYAAVARNSIRVVYAYLTSDLVNTPSLTRPR